MTKKTKSAADLQSELLLNSEHRGKMAEIKQDAALRSARLAVEERQLLADLDNVGVAVESVWDLVNIPTTYADAFPILAMHLQRSYSEPTLCGIARALASTKAHKYWEVLVHLYTRESTSAAFREGLAVALSAMAESEDLDTLATLIEDRSLGASRVFFVENLCKSGREKDLRLLGRLLGDNDLAQEITKCLARNTGRTKRV